MPALRKRKQMYAYPTRPIPLRCGDFVRLYRIANVVDIGIAGCGVDTLIIARVHVETLHTVYAGGVRVGRIYLATCIKSGFEVCLIALWTARVTSATVGCCCGSGGGSRRSLGVRSVGGGAYVCALGGGMGTDVLRNSSIESATGVGDRVSSVRESRRGLGVRSFGGGAYVCALGGGMGMDVWLISSIDSAGVDDRARGRVMAYDD